MSIVDLTGRHAVTLSGDPTFHATGGPFGAGYYEFDGVNDSIRFADTQDDFAFGTDDFSVAFYAKVLPSGYVVDGASIPVILDQGVAHGSGSWAIRGQASPKAVTGPGPDIPYSAAVDTWVKVEFRRVSGISTGYIDNVPASAGVNSYNYGKKSKFLDIGLYQLYYGKVSIAGLVIRRAGQVVLSALPVSVPTTLTTITSMEKDDGTPNDWLTTDGSAPRKVVGTIAAALTPDEIVEVSFDSVNWLRAAVYGLAWEITDNTFHTASWTIRARVTDTSTLLSAPETFVSVTLIPPQPTVLPRGAYTTLLDVIRRFMERTGLPKPAFSIGNTDAQVAQILGLLEEATEELVMRNARGWQILTREAVFVTKAQEVQGSLSELAPGFRAVTNDTLFNRTTRLPIYGPLLPMERQATKALQTAGPYYRYWIANDQLHLYPTPPAGQTIAFEYTSTACWSDGQSPATYSEYPTTDTAICLFPKPVVIAQLRWRWKKEKGLEYAQDFDSAELLLNAAIAADGTRRVVDLGGTELVARPGIMIPTGSWPLK